MIRPTANNRLIIKSFLEALSEDDFINQVIIPFFNMNGYILYRINSHGPGEHGKDIIFYRNVPIFYDHEFIAVQAKAEKVTTANVVHFADQLIRAYRTPTPAMTGTSSKPINYAIFINSKTHTNDANFEFPKLIESNNIKILSQDNMIELMFSNDFTPDALKGKLELYEFANTDFEEEIRNIILSNDVNKINDLLNTHLKIETRTLSDGLKGFIINYIFHKWDEDRSWRGTVQPMKWLRLYFPLIQESQFNKLFGVVEEYTSSNPSFEASSDTHEVMKMISPLQIKSFENKFIETAAYHSISPSLPKVPLIFQKLKEFKESNLVSKELVPVVESILGVYEQKMRLISSSDIKDRDAEVKKLKDLKSPIHTYLERNI